MGVKTIKQLTAFATMILMSGIASAGEFGNDEWMVRVGPATLSLQDEAIMTVGGQVVPDGTISTKDQQTPTIEISRYVADQFALSVTVGTPPRAEIEAAGSLEGIGRLANVDYGPAAVTFQYHPLRGQRVDPYIGVGAAYMIITNTQDGLMRDCEVENDFGAALQAGFNYAMNDNVGVYLDVKKAYLTTRATGTFNGMEAIADVVMDPLVISAGASFSF